MATVQSRRTIGPAFDGLRQEKFNLNLLTDLFSSSNRQGEFRSQLVSDSRTLPVMSNLILTVKSIKGGLRRRGKIPVAFAPEKLQSRGMKRMRWQ